MLFSHHRRQRPPECESCALMPLSQVASGQTVQLVCLCECKRLRKRLADLGLTTGQPVRVVQNHFAGPLILAVREDARLAIGRGMARQIQVLAQALQR